jgi:hypothetical protein
MTSIQKPASFRMDPLVAKLGDPRAATIPCPVLRTLVGEGLLTPDKNGMVDVAQLKSALKKIGLSFGAREGLAFGAKQNETGSILRAMTTSQFNIYKLAGSDLDHAGDTQIMRGGFNQARLDRLLSFSSDGKTISVQDLARAQKEQFAQEKTGGRGVVLGVAELSAVLMVFGKPDADGVKSLKLEDVTSLYRDAKFPTGFKPSKVGLMELVATMASLAYNMHFSTPGRAEAGLNKALGRTEMLDQSSALGLKNALCPVGMRPRTATPPVSRDEVAALHRQAS